MNEKKKDAFKDTSNTTQQSKEYDAQLIVSYNNNKNKTTSNPNPKNTSKEYVPTFIENYGPIEKTLTTTYLLSEEFNLTLVRTSDLMEEIRNKTENITSHSQEIKDSITEN